MWVPKPGTTASARDEPRRLTPEEIERISTSIPDILTPDIEANAIARTNIASWIASQLEDEMLAPSAIDDLIRTIVQHHHKATIAPGTTVGIATADGVGALTTQMALDSFHVSGSSRSVSHGIEAVRELLFARGERRRESTRIYFKEKLTFEDIIMLRAEFVSVTVRSIVLRYILDSPSNLSHHWWHDVFPVVTRRPLPPSKTVLRLYLDVNKMFAHRLSMGDVARAISGTQFTSREFPSGIIPVFSPLHEGVMDLYSDPRVIDMTLKVLLKNRGFISSDTVERAYLKMAVIPDLDRIRIKGIPNLNELTPDEPVAVWSIVKKVRKEPNDIWVITLNMLEILRSGVRKEYLINLLTLSGIEIIEETADELYVSSPIDPKKHIDHLLEHAAKEHDKKVEDAVKGGLRGLLTGHRTPLQEASVYYYADTMGPSDLPRVLSHPMVDQSRTFCNNFHKVANALGIEAARSLIIRELTTILGTVDVLNPRHISLIGDVNTSRGVPTGITFGGISRQPGGHLTLATFERAGEVFSNAALFGKKEDIRGVSASIMTGQKVTIGTGICEVLIDPDLLAEMKTMEVKRATRGISEEKFAEGLAELEGLMLGTTLTNVDDDPNSTMIDIGGTPAVPAPRIDQPELNLADALRELEELQATPPDIHAIPAPSVGTGLPDELSRLLTPLPPAPKPKPKAKRKK